MITFIDAKNFMSHTHLSHNNLPMINLIIGKMMQVKLVY